MPVALSARAVIVWECRICICRHPLFIKVKAGSKEPAFILFTVDKQTRLLPLTCLFAFVSLHGKEHFIG